MVASSFCDDRKSSFRVVFSLALSVLGMWDCLGLGNLAGLFGSLTHCFTELVLDIQNILSLIFRY